MLNDKYSTTLVRINPVKERTEQYKWEREQFEKISKQHDDKQIRIQRLEEKIKEMNYHETDMSGASRLDKLIDRPDQADDGEVSRNKQLYNRLE